MIVVMGFLSAVLRSSCLPCHVVCLDMAAAAAPHACCMLPTPSTFPSSLLLIICMVIDYPWPKTQTSGVPNMRIILPLPRTAGSEQQQQQQCNSNSSCSIDWGKCVSVGLSRVSLSCVARVSHVSQRGIGHE